MRKPWLQHIFGARKRFAGAVHQHRVRWKPIELRLVAIADWRQRCGESPSRRPVASDRNTPNDREQQFVESNGLLWRKHRNAERGGGTEQGREEAVGV
jgi:hypothetical protein